ncbi:DHA2 family efflux MFS transporter permease subunit [Herbiconiux solani]|uniref:DHA2 family efflux MFS transporter permease subunit n=1 Tax=Herbiconiux solani TaxID=661329 RepID=UPI000A03A808|nr:DHA2 family efflux MFS transporter permease subunit [Herbiconiux solani]
MSARRVPTALAIVAASLPVFMGTLDNLVVTSALPVIGRDLHASIEQLQWFVNAFTLSFATFMLLAVSLGDRYGRRRVFLIGIVVFTLSSAACALSTSPEMLIVSRAIEGAGAAAIMPLSLTLLVGSVPATARNLAIGIWGGVSGLGVALGPLIGGAVLVGWDWDAIFWINVPVGIVAVPLALYALPDSVGVRLRADVLGVVLAGLGILGVVYGIVNGNSAGWTSPGVLVPLVAGAALLVAFVFCESRVRDPLLPLRLFRDRSFSVANIVGLTFSFGMFGAVFILIQYLQIVAGVDALGAGLMTMPWTLSPLFIAPLTGILSPRVGTRVLIVVGCLLQAAAVGWLALTMTQELHYALMLPGFIAGGIGMGLVFAPISTAVLANMAPEDNAKASGANSTIREIGVALGIAVVTTVFVGLGGRFTPTGYIEAAVPAVGIGALVLLLAAIAALALPSGKGHGAAAAPAVPTHDRAGAAAGLSTAVTHALRRPRTPTP